MTPASARPVQLRLSSAPDVLRAGVRLAGRLAFAALVVFHVWLLWSHTTTGRLAEPDVATRWAAAVLVALGFVALRRLGFPLLTGRRAVVLWTLVLLIHCHAAWSTQPGSPGLGVPQQLLAFLPVSAPLGAALTLLTGLLWLAARRAQPVRLSWLGDLPARLVGSPSSGWTFCLTPRPPPLS